MFVQLSLPGHNVAVAALIALLVAWCKENLNLTVFADHIAVDCKLRVLLF